MMCLPITGHVAGSVAAAGGGGESVGVVIEEPRDPVGVVQLDIEMPPLPVREFRGRPGAGRIIVEAWRPGPREEQLMPLQDRQEMMPADVPAKRSPAAGVLALSADHQLLQKLRPAAAGYETSHGVVHA